MSYILDALRKADAERGRGAVPDLHAQPVVRSSAGGAPPSGVQPVVWIACTVAALAVGGLAWALLGREPAREPAAAAAPAAVVAVAAPTPPVIAPSPPSPPSPAPTTPPAAPIKAPAPVTRAAARPAAALAVPAAPAAAQTKPAVPPTEPRLYALTELPDEIRRELPALAIGGAMYSQNVASRMLIINGQVFHERDKLAPNLTLVQIRLKSAVLDFRGYRYSVSY